MPNKKKDSKLNFSNYKWIKDCYAKIDSMKDRIKVLEEKVKVLEEK